MAEVCGDNLGKTSLGAIAHHHPTAKLTKRVGRKP